MVVVVLREAYLNENNTFVIEKRIITEHPPVKGMNIINRGWSEFGEYDYVTDLFHIKRVIYDDDNEQYYACGKVELNELNDEQLQHYVLRMLRENRIGWKLYKVL